MHPLQLLLENQAFFEVRSYSGRSMYGRKCLGVEFDGNNGLGRILAAIIYGTNDDNREDLADAVKNTCTDSMGLGIIVYFPNVPYTEE